MIPKATPFLLRSQSFVSMLYRHFDPCTMMHPASTSYLESSSLKYWVALVIFIAPCLPFCRPDPRISEAGLFCGGLRVPPNSSYIPLFVKEMEVLSQLVTAHDWAHYVVNSTNISIFSLAQCYGDLSHEDCLQCYAASRTRLPRCLTAVAGRIFLDGCFLRYDDYMFYNESVDPVVDRLNCNSTIEGADGGGVVDLDFGERVGELVDIVARSAAAGEGHAAAEVRGVFGLAECWKTVSVEGCKACLGKASREVKACFPSKEGRALNAGCYLRYSTHKFFSNPDVEKRRGSGVSRVGKTVAIASSAIAFCMLSLFACFAAYTRWNKRKQERNNLGQISYSYNKSNLQFKYEVLEKATNYFDPSRKLGQGGAGSVYRGTLPNGKTVAVKRLLFSTRQWVDEFFNEVNLIYGIEHKNLVKLLGCSIEGPESLLVYEFVPRKSLDQYLFARNRIKVLNWKERHNIIVGVAEGIAFLHGGCEYRIIHRDIKSSNVLLDENLDPKIADFGLVRCFAADQTHLSTGIAGTLGYMAPEYLVKGQLTEKVDVYSFGVLVLEIVCGRKNNSVMEEFGSLIQTVWKLYKTHRLTDSVDPCLEGDFPALGASKVLKTGLLCAQASATLRPSMLEVVRMLTDENYEIPEPNQPPFLSTSKLSPASATSSCSFASNTVRKFEELDPSTDSFGMLSSTDNSGAKN
ncbi:cysteine-rich receptor-like protein kinase 42 [Henckelia pumila]|uniref:cysteine-rich receptor-like protein kinase 42 n=1 Tax=Henckelia pumila TaxID=405737 RepID=UPI003C6E2833